MGWAGHVAHMGWGRRNAYILDAEPEGEDHSEDLGIDLRERGWERVD